MAAAAGAEAAYAAPLRRGARRKNPRAGRVHGMVTLPSAPVAENASLENRERYRAERLGHACICRRSYGVVVSRAGR